MGELPLQAGGEAGAAPAPEAGLLDAVDDLLLGGPLGEDALQGGVAVGPQVFVDGLRIDDAAVAQGDAELVLVEAGLSQGGGRLVLLAALLQQAGDDAALDQVLGDDLRHVGLGHVTVAGPLGEHQHVGPPLAQADAAGLDHADLVLQLVALDLPLEGGQYLGAVRGGAAGAAAHQHVGANMAHALSLLIPRHRWCNR